MSNKFPISKETFKDYTQDAKLNTMFDLMHLQHECSCENAEKLDVLQKKFDRRKKLDTATSGFFGLVGGAAVVVFKKVIGGS